MTATPQTQTTEERFNQALAVARTKGVHVALNVMTCCRSCTTYTDMGLTEEAAGRPIGWLYGGQGLALVWVNGEPHTQPEVDDTCTCTEDEYGEDEDGNEILTWEGEECDICRYGPHESDPEPTTRVHFQHEGEAGAILRDAFVGQGFNVDWDGDPHKTVAIQF